MTKTEQGAQPTNPARLFVPRTAVMRRAEVFAVYVVNAQGKAVLRQIETGANARR